MPHGGIAGEPVGVVLDDEADAFVQAGNSGPRRSHSNGDCTAGAGYIARQALLWSGSEGPGSVPWWRAPAGVNVWNPESVSPGVAEGMGNESAPAWLPPAETASAHARFRFDGLSTVCARESPPPIGAQSMHG